MGAMAFLGYDPNVELSKINLRLENKTIERGDALNFGLQIHSKKTAPLLIDYIIRFNKGGGKHGFKVFKLKAASISPAKPVQIQKTHKFKWDATTFKLYPGTHQIQIQINGTICATSEFILL